VVELATLENARRRDRRAGTTLPQRLRSALTARGWVRRPEPRVRFGQPVLPGTSALGPAEREAAAAFVARAQALRDGRVMHLGRMVENDGRIDWLPRAASRDWQSALHALDELVAVGIAAATSSSAEERRGWYELAITTGRLKGAALRIWRMRRNDLTHFRRALGYTRDEQPPWSFASVTPEQLAARMAAREDDPIVESYPFEHTEGEDQ